MIYEHLVDFTGIVIVFAEHCLTREVNKAGLNLLHLNRTIREEISGYFYTQQVFQFRSIEATDRFLKGIGPHYASCIKNVQVGEQLSRRSAFEEKLPSLVESFSGIHRVSILHATKDWVRLERHRSHTGGLAQWNMRVWDVVVVGPRAKKLLRAAPDLTQGKLYYLHDGDLPELHFVPADVTYDNVMAKKVDFICSRDYDAIIELEMPDLEDLEWELRHQQLISWGT